jgi:hypothetical protein
MKKALLIVLAIVICAVAGAVYLGHSAYREIVQAFGSGCINGCVQVNTGGPMVKGSGNLKTENRTVAPFTAIELESPAVVVIDRTGTQGVSVTTDDNLLAFFTSDVKDGTLRLGTVTDKSFQASSAMYRITVSDLRSIAVRGSGDVTANHLDGPALAISIAGSGDVHVDGSVGELTLTIRGSGDIDAARLEAKRAKVDLSGSGDATVNASDTLDVRMSGSGDLHYLGSPKVTKDIHGSGSISAK